MRDRIPGILERGARQFRRDTGGGQEGVLEIVKLVEHGVWPMKTRS